MRKPDAQGMESGALRVHPEDQFDIKGSYVTKYTHKDGRSSQRAFTMAPPRSSASWAGGVLLPSKMFVGVPGADGILISVTTLHFLTPQAR